MEEHTATVIYLHGFGSDGPGRGKDLPELLNLPWVKYLVPIAPVRKPLQIGQAMQSWATIDPVDSITRQAQILAGAAGRLISGEAQLLQDLEAIITNCTREGLQIIEGDETDLDRNVDLVTSLIRREIRAGIPPERIAIIGFSQGGTVALAASLQAPESVGAVVALSTWFPARAAGRAGPGPDGPAGLAGMGRPGPAGGVLVCHGTGDWVVPVQLGREAFARCRELAVDVRYKEYDGLGHDIDARVARDVRRFILERIPRTAPARLRA